MQKLPDISAIIFDMDGLVLETETTYCIAWQKAAAEMGFVLTEQFCMSLSGLHFYEVEKRIVETCGTDFNINFFTKLSGKYWLEHVEEFGITLKKGFITLLSQLKKNHIPYCLATNSRYKNAMECLAFANIPDVFSTVISRDDVENGKPAPDIFLFAAQKLNVPIAECLVLEDSPIGIESAISAGAKSVFIPSILPIDQKTAEIADYCITDLEQLADIFHLHAPHPV